MAATFKSAVQLSVTVIAAVEEFIMTGSATAPSSQYSAVMGVR